MQNIAGYDKRDSTSADKPLENYTQKLNHSIQGKKIGIPKEFFQDDLPTDLKQAIEKIIDFYKKEQCEIIEINLPHTSYATPTYYIISTAEASSNLARFDGVRYGNRKQSAKLEDLYYNTKTLGFGDEVKRRILTGTFVLSSGYYDAYYLKAQKIRRIIQNDFFDAFKKVDVILTPTTPEKGFKIGEKTSDPIKMYLSDLFTTSASITGFPAISIPCNENNENKDNLTYSFQLIAPHFKETDLFNIGHIYQKAYISHYFSY